MPTPEEIASEQEKLYESASLRDDLNDAEATVLLNWGQLQVEQMAQHFPDDFEKQARFLRQLIKNINRFVGQREFNDMDGQQKYMADVAKYLKPLNYTATDKDLFAALPANPKDMMANLKAILTVLTPNFGNAASPTLDTPTPNTEAAPLATEPPPNHEGGTMPAAQDITYQPNDNETEILPDINQLIQAVDTDKGPPAPDNTVTFRPNIDKTEVIPDISHLIANDEAKPNDPPLENANTGAINQPLTEDVTGENTPHDEKDE